MPFSLKTDDLTGPEIRALIEFHLRDMQSISPPESCHAFDVDKLRHPDVTFWSVWSGDALAGCAALKQLAPDWGEVKSMRTAPAFLRQGVARLALRHLIDEARARGYERLSLETGSPVEFHPAKRLYEEFGFVECPPFGDYKLDPYSIFMTRLL